MQKVMRKNVFALGFNDFQQSGAGMTSSSPGAKSDAQKCVRQGLGALPAVWAQNVTQSQSQSKPSPSPGPTASSHTAMQLQYHVASDLVLMALAITVFGLRLRCPVLLLAVSSPLSIQFLLWSRGAPKYQLFRCVEPCPLAPEST